MDKYILIACLALVSLLTSGCLTDPFPEPDPYEDDEESNENDEDGDDEDDFDDDDDEDDDTDTDDLPPPPRLEKLFCSAPSGETGLITVVGLTDCVKDAPLVRIRGQGGQWADLPVYRDGSFAGRFVALEREELSFTAVSADNVESLPVMVAAGVIEGDPIENGIMGTGEVFPPDAESQVAIQGNGDRLTSGDVVVGGNIAQSTGVSTLVSANEFDLFIPGQPGEPVDLFLVRSGEHSGFTDPQTVAVP